MKIFNIFIICIALCIIKFDSVHAQGLLIDDFEGVISGGADGFVDFGSGNGSKVEVSQASDIKQSGKQSLKVIYDAVSGGYMWIARGYGLEAKNSAWLVNPDSIDWKQYNTITFYLYGSDSKTKIAFDIKDNSNEIWRFMLEDNFKGWKQIVCPLNEFFERSDWQPDSADKNSMLDFPLKSYQFEPLPPSKGTLYFEDVELVKK